MTDGENTALTLGFEHLKASQYFFVASCVIQFYDHGLTISEEVEHIWKQRLTLATLLFLIIRYATSLILIILMMGFYYPALSTQLACNAFIKFPGAASIIILALIEIIMSLRTYALYGRNMLLLICLLVLLGGQVGIMSVLVRTGQRMPFPRGVVGCALMGKHAYLVAYWLCPLVLDTVIFGLTLHKIRQRRGNAHENTLLQVILKDGIMYYVVICVVNLLNVLLYLSAPEDLKVIGGTFSYVMTTIMLSRLVLNLQSFRAEKNPEHLELANRNRTGSFSAILTTQFQSSSVDRVPLDVQEIRRSLQNIRRRPADTSWFGALGSRLADEEWVMADAREHEQSDGMENDNARVCRDAENPHAMDSS